VIWHCWLGSRKGIWPVKTWVVRYWCGYLSGVRCKWFAYQADATATPSSLAPVKYRMVYLSGAGLPSRLTTNVVLGKPVSASVFSSMTTKTKIFIDKNKLIFDSKTTTKIWQFSSTKRKLKLKFNLLTKITTKIWLFSSTRRKFQSRILA